MRLVSLDFYILTFILGFGAAVIVGKAAIQTIDQGGNMAALLLAEVLEVKFSWLSGSSRFCYDFRGSCLFDLGWCVVSIPRSVCWSF